MRNGFTTGTASAAAVKASATMALSQQEIQAVEVSLPQGEMLTIEINDIAIKENFSSCSVIKDAGDDPDVTNGIKIFASVKIFPGDTIEIIAGEGIGVVTKKGLPVEMGQAAINPVPRKMIEQGLHEVLQGKYSAEVRIWIPEGEKIAKKTFNPQLGIVGGISIIGTTGIVRPMSEDALKTSLCLRLKVIRAQETEKAVFVLGNYGEKFAINQLHTSPDMIAQTSNYIGFMFDEAVKLGFKHILIAGHIGKMIKLAGGIFNTHSKIADARNEIFAAHYMKYSGDTEAFLKIMNSNTAEEAVNYVSKKDFYGYISNIIAQKIEQRCHAELKADVVLFSHEKGRLN